MYQQYCLLLAPKHTLKIIISYFPGATQFPYYATKRRPTAERERERETKKTYWKSMEKKKKLLERP